MGILAFPFFLLSWKLSVLEIPLDKELTSNCLIETHTKLEELILAAMVKYGMNRVRLPLWLKQSLINGSEFLMVWFVLGHSGQRTSVKCAEVAWNYKAGGIVHLKSPAFACVWVCYQEQQKIGILIFCTKTNRNFGEFSCLLYPRDQKSDYLGGIPNQNWGLKLRIPISSLGGVHLISGIAQSI